MNKNDKSEFLNAFLSLCEMFEKEPSERLIGVWWKIFEKYSLEDFQKGIGLALVSLRNYGRLPMPGDVIELIETGGVDLEVIAEIQALEVIEAVKKIGVYETVVFKDRITMAVVLHGFGGWVQLCSDLKKNDEKWFRKDFVRLYKAYKKENVIYTGKLIGLVEAENEAQGFVDFIPKPVFIGEKLKQIEG